MYKSIPVLLCVKSDEYCNRVLKADAYEKLVQKLKEIDPNADRVFVMRKINNFRTSYRRDYRKQRKSEKSGVGADDIFQSSLWYFDLLHFVDSQEDTIQGTSTMTENESDHLEAVDESPRPGTSKRKRVANEEDKLIKLACAHLKESNNDATLLARRWSIQYSAISSQEQKIFVRKLISDILFAGCLGKLNENAICGFQRLLQPSNRSSTPYWSESFVSSPTSML